MKMKVIRTEEKVITCELEDGLIIDLERQLISDNIKIGSVIEFDINISYK